MAVGADWHMAEIGGFVTAHASLPFPAQVAIGRALTLWFIGEAMRTMITLVSVNRLPLSARRHLVYALSGVAAAASPLVANAAQLVTQPFLAIFVSSACAALAQAGLWAIVYLLTGICLDWLAGRPPRFDPRLEPLENRIRQRRDLRRAVHGLHPDRCVCSALARRRSDPRTRRAHRRRRSAARSPSRSPRRSSAAPTGRRRSSAACKAAYRDPRAPGRAASSSASALALAYEADLAAFGGGDAVSGDVRGRRAGLRRRRPRLRRRRASSLGKRREACRAGGLMRWACCSAASSPARSAGISTRPSSRSSSPSSGPTPTSTTGSTAARSATSPPIRSSTNTAMVNLGEVAGGVRLFWAESVAGVINWSLAAPLFSINYVLLDAALRAQPAADQEPRSARRGVEGLVEQGGARVALGPVDGPDHQLVPAPVARSVLVQPGRRGAHARGDRRRRRPRLRKPSAGSACAVHRPARLRLAAHPDLVRPHGPEGRDPRQSVVSRRRPGRRSRGPVHRPQRRARAPFPTESAGSAPGRRC